MIKKYFLLLLFFSSVSVYSQNVKITGFVYNENREPLEYVLITHVGTSYGAISEIRGHYELNISSRQDSLEFLFSLIGYKKKQIKFPIAPGIIELDSVFLENDDRSLSEIAIEAESKVTTTIERVDYLAVKRPANPWGSLESLLATMGGVSSTNELSSQYSVRGGNFDENIVYVNGIEIYRPQLVRSAQQEGLSFINPNMIKSVGFSAGGFSAEYGDKMSSVLDITYKRPERFEGSASASFLGGDVYVGSSTDRFSQVTGVRYKTTRSLLNTTDTKAEYDPSFIDLQTYITYNFSPKWEVSLLGNYSHNIFEFTPTSRETTFGSLLSPKSFLVVFDGWEKDKFLTYQGALTLKGKITDKLTLGISGSAFSSDEQERYDIQGRYSLEEAILTDDNSKANSTVIGIGSYHEHARNKLESKVYNISHFGDFEIENHLLKWGISIQGEKVEDRIKEWEMRDSAGYSLPSTGTEVNMYSNLKSTNKINSMRFSGYLQDTYTFDSDAGIFILNVGVRGSYWQFNEELIFSPRGGLAFVPKGRQNLSFRISGGVYYQTPFYKELQYITQSNGNNVVVLNDQIKSQRSIHVILGNDFYFKINRENNKPFKLSTEVYYKALSDLNPYTVNNVKIRYAGENTAKGYATGIDMKLYGEFIPGVDSWISMSFMKTGQKTDDVTVPLPTDQRFNFALFFQDYLPGYDRIKMNLRGLWSQGLPVSAPYKSYETGYFRTPSYKRVDIGFSWQILGEDFAIRNNNSFCKAFKNIWLGVDLFNVFDMQNVNTYYWVTDVHNLQYAVPNYLTERQINFKLSVDF
ncbi:MAG: TonB-dependent receptor [Prevotella sp.]|jgi:hypothetical protein|nr:TonB-dependent receptor [Prevotella sp.]